MYVAIEGIDTAGKSTQIKLLQNRFQDAIFIKEPGATDVGKKIRKLIFNSKEKPSIKTELLLFLADRTETMEKIIKPNYDKLIISDRSFISGMAYGLEYFDLLELELFNSFATDRIYPDIVFILKLKKEDLIERLQQKKKDSIEERGISYLLSVQENMIEITNRFLIDTIIIDASNPVYEIEEIIKSKIRERLKR
jgi:dTMP kinase